MSYSCYDSQCSVEWNVPLEGGTFLWGRHAALPSLLSCARNLHPSPSWNKKYCDINNILNNNIVFIFLFSFLMITKWYQLKQPCKVATCWCINSWGVFVVWIWNVFTATGSAGLWTLPWLYRAPHRLSHNSHTVHHQSSTAQSGFTPWVVYTFKQWLQKQFMPLQCARMAVLVFVLRHGLKCVFLTKS